MSVCRNDIKNKISLLYLSIISLFIYLFIYLFTFVLETFVSGLPQCFSEE